MRLLFCWGRFCPEARRFPLVQGFRFLLALLALLTALLPACLVGSARADTYRVRPRRLALAYAGLNYYDPTEYFTHCPDFTWLQPSCYDSSRNPDPPRNQLISDLRFVADHHLGGTQRVWISLDELMRWNAQTGFVRFTPGVLHNVDDMLALYHRYRMKVILVLFVYGLQVREQFDPSALDGRHPAMRRNYLRAERIFIRHLARNSTDRVTAPILELQTEPYYQLEEYFNDPARLGTFRDCASGRQSNWGCVDRRIIHPWLISLYRTARSSSSSFLYTFSDTGRLFEDYRYWNRMYPEDVIDEHLYDNAPWKHASRYAGARRFSKPWFASEVGCASGNIRCTYSGTASTGVDSWWLRHLRADGAQAVLVECHVTLWLYPNGPNSQVPTNTGVAVERATRTANGRGS